MNGANGARGSCQCGTITFTVSGPFDSFFLCHCSRCRKDTGSAHAANLFSSTAVLEWVSGADSVRTYRVPGTGHEKSFCIGCGAAVPIIQMNGQLLVVPAGSLDTEIAIAPTGHICVGDAAEWDEQLSQAPRFDGLPGPG